MELTEQFIVQSIDTIPNLQAKPTSSEYDCNNKKNIGTMAHCLRSNQNSEISTILSPSVVLNTTPTGSDSYAVVAYLGPFKASLPDIIQLDEYIVGEGNYTIAESVAQVTFNGEHSRRRTARSSSQTDYTRRSGRFFEHNNNDIDADRCRVHSCCQQICAAVIDVAK